MGLRINTNVSSLQAQRRLNETTRAFARSLQRLSSGKRINRAGDDASGLAISEGLKSQSNALTRGVRNINDAFGFLSTAEGAMRTQLNILQRVRELAIQASNGTLGANERGFLNTELNEAMEEFQRLSSQTAFNGTSLLNGDFETQSVQVGGRKGQSIDISIGNIDVNQMFRKDVASGEFSEVDLSPDEFAEAAAIGDVDGDGDNDILTSFASNIGGLFINDGSGNFTEQAAGVADLGGRRFIDLADLDGDGDLDAVSTDGSELAVSLNDGNGNFQTPTTYGGSTDTFDFIFGDIDNDGDLDIVQNNGLNAEAYVRFNDGDGNFTSSTTLTLSAIGKVRDDLALGDIDGDQDLDLIVAVAGSVEIFLNDGNGGFTSQGTMWANDPSPNAVRLADITGDGNLDLAVSTSSWNDYVWVYEGAGDGSFNLWATAQTGNRPENLEVIDFDNDGVLDFITSDRNDNTISFVRGLGNGSYAAATTVAVSNVGAVSHLAVGDLDMDGYIDALHGGTTGIDMQIYFQGTQNVSAFGDIDVSTQARAQEVLALIDTGITFLTTELSSIGAQQNRLTSALNANLISVENLEAAKAQVLDADLAQETAELARSQILQQAATSVLGQANTNMQIVLSLLGRLG
jgi:flagellin